MSMIESTSRKHNDEGRSSLQPGDGFHDSGEDAAKDRHNLPAFKQPGGFRHRLSPTARTLETCYNNHQAAFIGYFPYGFPDVPGSLLAMDVLCQHGVDIVEIGLPYSDPVMDGPVLQAASNIALDHGERVDGVFDAVERVAAAGAVPLIMTYWNLVFHYGVERFAADLENAGGAGLITPDLIPDEAGEWIEASDRHGLDRIFLVSPGSDDERLRSVAANSRGFVYAASRMGVTGEQQTLSDTPQRLVERTRIGGAQNVCVGIGVSTAAQGAQVGKYADGVIVGSTLVHAFLDDASGQTKRLDQSLSALADKAQELADGIHNARKGYGTMGRVS